MNSKYRIKKSTAEKVKLMFTYALLILMAAIMLVPFLWMLSASLKLEKDVFSYPIVWIPRDPQWQNYVEIWKKVPLLTGFFNTTKLTVCTVVLQLLTSSLAAYAFAKLEFMGRDSIFMIYVMTISIPWQVYMLPQYSMMNKFHLVDTHTGYVLMQSFTAFGVFLMRQFFMSLPNELLEAGRIDGLSEYGNYFRIALPLSKPSIATMTIFSFVAIWNDYMGPLIYFNSTSKKTIQLGIKMFIGQYSTEYGLVMAASVLSLIPVLIIFLGGQKFFVQGIASSGIKG